MNKREKSSNTRWKHKRNELELNYKSVIASDEGKKVWVISHVESRQKEENEKCAAATFCVKIILHSTRMKLSFKNCVISINSFQNIKDEEN
jgi:hypothetical protein